MRSALGLCKAPHPFYRGFERPLSTRPACIMPTMSSRSLPLGDDRHLASLKRHRFREGHDHPALGERCHAWPPKACSADSAAHHRTVARRGPADSSPRDKRDREHLTREVKHRAARVTTMPLLRPPETFGCRCGRTDARRAATGAAARADAAPTSSLGPAGNSWPNAAAAMR